MRALAKVVQVMPGPAAAPGRGAGRDDGARELGEPGPGERGSGHPHHRRAGLPGQRTAPLLLHRRRRPAHRPHVEPHRLVLLGHRWYLAGYDLGRHDWRSFRLDRLTAPGGTGTRFRPRTLPAADAAAFVRAGVDSVTAAYDVEVLIGAPAAAVRQRIGQWAAVEDIDATRCRIRMTADSLDWPVLALGAAGASFQVISPPELLEPGPRLGPPIQPGQRHNPRRLTPRCA